MNGALRVAEKLRTMMRGSPLQLTDGRALALTLSIGAAERRPGETLKQAIERADHALLDSKRIG